MDNNKLVEDNINLVHKICHMLYDGKNHKGIEYEDLFSEGCVALVEASKRYKPSTKYKWAKFGTFAYHCIENRLKNFILYIKKESQNINLLSLQEKNLPYITEEYIPYNIANLSPGMQQVVQLRDQGYTVPEISSIVVFPNGKTRSSMSLWRKIKSVQKTAIALNAV